MGFLQRIKAFFHYAYAAALKAASLEGDIVFATSTPLTVVLPAVYAAKRKRIPMVFEVRDLWPSLPIAIGALKSRTLIRAALWLERFAYRNAAQVIALSPGMRDGVVKTGYPKERVHVIPNSSDMELFGLPDDVGISFRKKYDWLQDRPLVVYTGALGRINGVSYLVELAAMVKEEAPDIRFLVVGDGQEQGLIHGLAKSQGVLNVSFFLFGRLPKREIPAVLSAATVATSLVIDIKAIWDNSANKFFDALASGTPIVINYDGWQAELIKETGAGIVLPPKDITKAAQLLVSAIRDKKWLDDASAAALKLARTRFDRNELARQLEAVLRSVVDGKTK
jgi:glycosyltransferase involved in cell wall biosynthesis